MPWWIQATMFLCIPQACCPLQLQLPEHEMREVTMADGSRKLVPYVGPLKINYDEQDVPCWRIGYGRNSATWRYSIEDMDLNNSSCPA